VSGHAFDLAQARNRGQDISTGVLRNVAGISSQILNDQETQRLLNDQYESISKGIHSNRPRMMQILTTAEPEQIGIMGRVYQKYEDMFTFGGAFVPLSNDVSTRPDQRYQDLPFFKELFGPGGAASGIEFDDEPVADAILGLIEGSRDSMNLDVVNILKKDGKFTDGQINEALESAQQQISWEETNLKGVLNRRWSSRS
jgi:hypothetical protein